MTFYEQYGDAIEVRRAKLRKRGFALAAETNHPTSQAVWWYGDAIQCVPRSGQAVARQIARLCGDDSEVTVPWRSLADAVGVRDRAGNLRRYTERGVKALTDAGWLEVETVGSKRGAKTTFRLLPGDRSSERLGWIDDEEWFTEAA
ncbi:hypothetical protein [Streptomyces naphthomycinicus]|uniref:hypothetical protein n=1 Tax=Streptomyces naphthomycinicus TaxID=2872625 RepID=UPI001CEDE9E5|nr:hypothetical protein [Streptomyces sp. TML10]